MSPQMLCVLVATALVGPAVSAHAATKTFTGSMKTRGLGKAAAMNANGPDVSPVRMTVSHRGGRLNVKLVDLSNRSETWTLAGKVLKQQTAKNGDVTLHAEFGGPSYLRQLKKVAGTDFSGFLSFVGGSNRATFKLLKSGGLKYSGTIKIDTATTMKPGTAFYDAVAPMVPTFSLKQTATLTLAR